MSFYNPFQGREIKFSDTNHEIIDNFCQTQPKGGKRKNIEDSPFKRQIDFWFISFCLGVKFKNKEDNTSELKKMNRFITGEIFANDSNRIDLLETWAIANVEYEKKGEDGTSILIKGPAILNYPNIIIDEANRYAAGGVKILINSLSDGSDKAIWNLTTFFETIIK